MKTPFQTTVPKTSESLLIAIASNPGSARWADFVKRYEPMMRAVGATPLSALELARV